MKHPLVIPKRTGLSILLILSIAAIQLRAQKWEEIAQFPFAVLLPSAKTVGDEIYVFGGFTPDAATTVYAFNPNTKTWRARHWMPKALAATATAVLNGKVYLFGGAESSSGTMSKKCYVYDPVTDTWATLKDMSVNRGYATAEAVNGKIYIIGGFGHGAASRFDLVEEYDPELDTFITKTHMPTPRGYLTSTVMNNRIYVIGGGVPLTFEALGAVEVYDPTTNAWVIADDLPTPRWGMAAATINSMIYVAGGALGASILPDTALVEVYTEEIGWQTGDEPLPFRMHGLAMTAFHNKLYTFGGVVDYDYFVDAILRYNPMHTDITLSSEVVRMGTASLDSKVFFAGGSRSPNFLPSTAVDIFDVNSQQWTTSNLSIAREFPAGTSNGNKVFFAGGINFLTGATYATVDIYDLPTMQWTTAQLSQPRFGIAAVSYGNEVLFAGGASPATGTAFATVDVYNVKTGTWSTTVLSEARTGMGYAVAGTKAIFAGGFDLTSVTDRVDIYDFSTHTWTTESLSQARGFVSAAAIGTKVIIAGGIIASNTPSDRVDIYDVVTGVWTTSTLSAPRGLFDYGASACGKAYFAGGGNFNFMTQSWTSASDIVDIYDVSSETWSVEYMSHPAINHSVVANGNQVFIAGGSGQNTEFDNVDIFTCTGTVGNAEISPEIRFFKAYPNPADGYLTVAFEGIIQHALITIADMNGKTIFTTSTWNPDVIEVNLAGFAEGVYFVYIQSDQVIETQKIVVAQ